MHCKVHDTPTGTCLSCRTGIKTWMKTATLKGLDPVKSRKYNGFDIKTNSSAEPVIIRTTDTDRLWDVFDRHGVWTHKMHHVKEFPEDDYLTEYPVWFAVKKLRELGEPKYYMYGKALPLFAVYHGYAFVTMPVTNDVSVKCPHCNRVNTLTHIREKYKGFDCEQCGRYVKTNPEMWDAS